MILFSASKALSVTWPLKELQYQLSQLVSLSIPPQFQIKAALIKATYPHHDWVAEELNYISCAWFVSMCMPLHRCMLTGRYRHSFPQVPRYNELDSVGKQCLMIERERFDRPAFWVMFCVCERLSAHDLISKSFSVSICKMEIQISTSCFVGGMKSVAWHLAYSKCSVSVSSHALWVSHSNLTFKHFKSAF